MKQAEALELLNKGKNVFLTGPPGAGKSYVIEQFVKLAHKKGKVVALTATTGIAASLIGGITIHSWSGIGVNNASGAKHIENILANPIVLSRIRQTDILIIDEISMLDGATLEKLNDLFKKARSNNAAFGGLQVIFSGDFFQLPPVSFSSINYAFESEVWQQLNFVSCYLSEQHRQGKDQLSEVLLALREQRLNKEHLDLLLERRGLVHPDITMLLTHNREVDLINSDRLAKLSSKEYSFTMTYSGKMEEAERLAKNILAPNILMLKIGAPVMFVANNFSEGYVNGSQGRVIKFKSGLPVVELEKNNKQIIVEPYAWKYSIDDRVVAEVSQLPVRLAWAITIHKSQGMSLEMADIDLSRSFTYGMGYVALSRLRSYEGLYLRGLNSRSLQLDARVYAFDKALKLKDITNIKRQQISDDILKEVNALTIAGASLSFIKTSLGISVNEIREIQNKIAVKE